MPNEPTAVGIVALVTFGALALAGLAVVAAVPVGFLSHAVWWALLIGWEAL